MRTTVHCVRTIVLIFLFSHFTTVSFSQAITSGNGKFEIGAGIGPMIFLGDLGGTQGKGKSFLKDVNLPVTNPSFGAYLNVYPTEWLGFRLAFNKSTLEGADSLIVNKGGHEQARYQRNLSFQSPVFEAYVATEIYPTVFIEQYDGLQGKLRPYGVLGVGFFKFNPKTSYKNQNGVINWVELQPLRTEGQGMLEYPDRKPYKLISMEIPMGFGMKYYINDNKYIGFEVLHRKTFTDYIDDVSTNYINANLFNQYLSPEQASLARRLHYRGNEITGLSRPAQPRNNEQRGDPKDGDSFFSSMLRFGWRLNDMNSPSGRATRQLRCPTFY